MELMQCIMGKTIPQTANALFKNILKIDNALWVK